MSSTMAPSQTASHAELVTLLRAAKHAHAEAFADVGGADPDWPRWYAEHLLAEAPDAFGGRSASELTAALVLADRAQRAEEGARPWEEAYAEFLAERRDHDVPGVRTALRHALATVAYRASITVAGAPEGFGAFTAPGAVRSPVETLAHTSDVLTMALAFARGEERPARSSPPWTFEAEVERFYATCEAFDARLRDPEPLAAPWQRLLQGPIADALTHVGQLALLRRLAGAPLGAARYYGATIEPGVLRPQIGD
jgi:hypothetical protein